MSRVKVRSDIQVYEIDGTEVTVGLPDQIMTVESHWNRNEMVILSFGERKVTISASDLEKAIKNATNLRVLG